MTPQSHILWYYHHHHRHHLLSWVVIVRHGVSATLILWNLNRDITFFFVICCSDGSE